MRLSKFRGGALVKSTVMQNSDTPVPIFPELRCTISIESKRQYRNLVLEN